MRARAPRTKQSTAKDASTSAAPRRRVGRPPRGPLEIMLSQGGILRAAADVFNRMGGEDVPVEEILQRAGISRATFYKNFRTKDQLLEGLFEIAARALVSAIEQAISAEGEPVDRIRAGVRAYLAFHVSEPGVVRVLTAAAMRRGTPLAEQRRKTMERVVEIFSRELARQGRAQLDPLLIYAVVIGLEGVSQLVLDEASGPGARFEKPSDQSLERAERVMMRVLTASLAHGEPWVTALPEAPPQTSKRAATRAREGKD